MSDELSLRLTTPGDREIVMTREFRAPRHRVYDAYTKPELLRRWFGPHGYSLVVCDIDLRVDGHWRYVVRGPDGSDMTLQGFYQEIVRAELLVSTQTFDERNYV
ncbi:MAG: SRPBCC domain-containing protein, partial [Actinomycetota bacterium]|nr:SRPBCC domain-containing protein [Actinomycetota bacterium]